MKKTALTMAISSLLPAGGAQAANVYDQNGTNWTSAAASTACTTAPMTTPPKYDASYLRLHIAGETKADEDLTAFGFAEYNLPVSGSDNDELRYAYAGISTTLRCLPATAARDGLFTKAVNKSVGQTCCRSGW